MTLALVFNSPLASLALPSARRLGGVRLIALCIPGLAACVTRAPAPPTSATIAAAAGTSAPRHKITDVALRAELTAFAHDSMRGRETGTPDAMRAARFIADRLRAMAAEPAGDSGYVQRVPLVWERFAPATSFTVVEAGRAAALALGNDVIPIPGSFLSPGAPTYAKQRAEGDVVFAGYGVTMPTRDDLAGFDLSGKVVVVVNGAPADADSATRRQLESLGGIAMRLQRLIPLRPAAIVVLVTGEAEAFSRQMAREVMRLVSPAKPVPPTDEAQRQLPMLLLGVARPGSPLLPSGWPSDDRARPLAGRRFNGRVEVIRDPFTAYNVVAVVRGSDPQLARTYVALSAHHDHIGIQPAVGGDSIANGADDNGSASVVLLEIARALVTAPRRPLRSTLFIWHDAEEKGLLGSAYFAEHPTVPLDSIVGVINADMLGRHGWGSVVGPPPGTNAENTLFLVGPGAEPNGQNRVLGQLADSVNARQAMPFALNRELDSPTHPERPYMRSDHYSYARKGIPAVFFSTGLHPDYHRPTDEPSAIVYPKLARSAMLMHDLAVAVANRRSRPR